MNSYALRRAQRNPYGVMPLVIITKGWKYDYHYRTGADDNMRLLQNWLYGQVGKTWRRVSAMVIYSNKTAEEHKAGNIYLDIQAQINNEPTRYDQGGEKLDFCNSKRLYALYSTGDTGLKNMGGRSAFNCSIDPTNPYEPWGPGRAGGPSAWAMELVAGHPTTPPATDPGFEPVNMSHGALIHEMLHCIGVQHPDPAVDGPDAWLTPMGGWWFFGRPECKLLPREIAQLRGSHFFA